MGARTTRILVVEDHALLRDGVASLLARQPGVEIVGAVPSIRRSMPLVERAKPDLILAGLCLEDGSAVQLSRALRLPSRRARLLLLSGFNDWIAAVDLEDSGAAGLVLTAQSTDDLLRAIGIVVAGGRYVAPMLRSNAPKRGTTTLSRREREVFRMITAGYQSKEIARRLFVSLKTVDTHRGNINQKLSVHTTAELVRFAHAHGIVVGPRHQIDADPRATC